MNRLFARRIIDFSECSTACVAPMGCRSVLPERPNRSNDFKNESGKRPFRIQLAFRPGRMVLGSALGSPPGMRIQSATASRLNDEVITAHTQEPPFLERSQWKSYETKSGTICSKQTRRRHCDKSQMKPTSTMKRFVESSITLGSKWQTNQSASLTPTTKSPVRLEECFLPKPLAYANRITCSFS